MNFDVIYKSLTKLYGDGDDYVLWIQQGDSFWGNRQKFVKLLKYLKKKKVKNIVVTHHTLNFQNRETKYGFTKWQYKLLKNELPYIDVNTVFTKGVYSALTKAFPKYKEKTVLIRHGVLKYPRISQKDAKIELLNWLKSKNKLDQHWQNDVNNLYSKIFEENSILFGDTGFISGRKHSYLIYNITRILQKRLIKKNIIGLYIGTLGFSSSKKNRNLEELRNLHDPNHNFYFYEDYIPEHLFAKSLKTFDIVHMWQEDCRQSGKLAHAIGIGAFLIGRNIEGVGETLKMCGYPALNTYKDYVDEIERVIINPELKEKIEKKASQYVKSFNWEMQSLKHIKLVKALISVEELPLLDA